MTKFRNTTSNSSLKYAVRGIFIAVKTQKNIRISLFIAFIVLLAAVLFGFSAVEVALVLITSSFVIFAELVNTTIEYVVDTYFRNQYSKIAEISKDVAAAAVLFAVLNSVVVGLLLFLPKIAEKIDALLFVIYP